MKVEPVSKLDKTNKATSKKFDGDVISPNCDVIVIFPICDNLKLFGSRIPDA